MSSWTPKQRMLAAYRGLPSDRSPVAPELWYYYPAKLLGVDMIEFERDVSFHRALKTAFEYFSCEGWGAVFAPVPRESAAPRSVERWIDSETLEVESNVRISSVNLTTRQRFSRSEPSWVIERPVKDLSTDLVPWADSFLAGDIDAMDLADVDAAVDEVGEAYLLEGWLGVPFFDWYGSGREGGANGSFAQTVFDFYDAQMQPILDRYQERYTDYLVRLAKKLCTQTTLDSLCIGCSWSCNSLEGPELWRRWDKPVIAAVAREVHAHDKLLHIHFHGKCLETIVDFSEIGVDCVCPFERPPGGDVSGIEGLRRVQSHLGNDVTMNGNVHTVETLIRGTVVDVRQQVDEILEVFAGSNRLIVGTGDQVGRETPEKNIAAMVEQVKKQTSMSQ